MLLVLLADLLAYTKYNAFSTLSEEALLLKTKKSLVLPTYSSASDSIESVYNILLVPPINFEIEYILSALESLLNLKTPANVLALAFPIAKSPTEVYLSSDKSVLNILFISVSVFA